MSTTKYTAELANKEITVLGLFTTQSIYVFQDPNILSVSILSLEVWFLCIQDQ